jgi:hypothetical protein
MSWAGLADNQTISFTNLKDAVDTSILVQKTTIPTSNEQITKTDADTYVNIDTSSPSYAAKSANQLVTKSNLTSSVVGFQSQGIIASGKGIIVGDTVTVAGLLCTNTNGTSCPVNYRFSATVDDNNTVSTLYNNGTGYPSGINSVRANFQVKTNGTYTVTANVKINGVSKGSNSVTGTYTTGDFPYVVVTLSSAVNFGDNLIMRIEYS